MAKVADKYFKENEWKIIEEGFNPKYGEVSESIFSLGNEYMGVRGYFEEGYSGKKLIGSYFNGIYERTKPNYNHYKGVSDFTEYMVNSVDWLYTRIELDGETLDLAVSKIDKFYRELDFRTGVLIREFIWETENGKQVAMKFERCLSMTKVERSTWKLSMKALNFDGNINIVSGLDFSNIHRNSGMNMWNCKNKIIRVDRNIFLNIEGTTVNTGLKVNSSCRIKADYDALEEVVEDKLVAVRMSVHLKKNQEQVVIKNIRHITSKDEKNTDEYRTKVSEEKYKVEDVTAEHEALKESSYKWWSDIWKRSDITIEDDSENQQGIRFCIFQMYQTYNGAVEGTNIGAKGLTGEAYNGNAFWDTETYCLPFFLFNDREGARNLLLFRYKTLNEARERAKVLDCDGAFYPIATISGKECCNLWQHASLQMQASTSVAYGIWFYEKIYGDKQFIKSYGLEMLIEISRMLASRGDFDKDGRYGYYCVMGPDEFQMMVHNNCYTNYMGRFTLDYTLKKIEEIKNCDNKAYESVKKKVHFDESEMEKWEKIVDNMIILYDEETMLFEQHDGFYKLPHLDVDKIPVEDFPLYNHWSYERIYRNDMIKQPDVLMFMLLFNSRFTLEQLKANYEYYEPHCIHESSLSPSVHSILASQLGKEKEAYEFFEFATRMDLDNYNRNTGEGIHTTSIAAAWMNIVYGFGGLRSDGEKLVFSPTIPKGWRGYSFKVSYKNEVIEVKVSQDTVFMKTMGDGLVEVKVYGKDKLIDHEGIHIALHE